MCIRDSKRGVAEVFGTATNSEGVTGKKIWGRAAKWVDYSGPIDGKTMGISIFDSPSNLRHPTTWHAREYGLVAANPFGLHHFTKAKKGTGEHELKEGEQLNLRYRVVFHVGDCQTANVKALYKDFTETPWPDMQDDVFKNN